MSALPPDAALALRLAVLTARQARLATLIGPGPALPGEERPGRTGTGTRGEAGEAPALRIELGLRGETLRGETLRDAPQPDPARPEASRQESLRPEPPRPEARSEPHPEGEAGSPRPEAGLPPAPSLLSAAPAAGPARSRAARAARQPARAAAPSRRGLRLRVAPVPALLAALLLLLLGLLLPRLAGATPVVPEGPAATAAICDAVATLAARESGVPLEVMRAITRTETGRRLEGELRPWPWTINMEGKGVWFDNAEEAVAYARKEYERGARSFDMGCFQINYRWHGENFASLEEMMEPLANARYAAKYLLSLHAEKGDWLAAAGRYHSATAEFADRYKARFAEIMARLPGAPDDIALAALAPALKAAEAPAPGPGLALPQILVTLPRTPGAVEISLPASPGAVLIAARAPAGGLLTRAKPLFGSP